MDALEPHGLLYRLIFLVRFVAFMGGCYLLLHVLAARLFSPKGRVVAFFQIVTGPLTRPIRALAPAMPERRARHIALLILFGIWVLSAWSLAVIGGRPG